MRKAAFSLIALLALSWPFVAPWVQAQTFAVLYSFTGGADGSSPQAGLVRDKRGNLYGTTAQGGSSANCFLGCGVVFKLDTWGNETVLHTFTNTPDGALPQAGLVRDRAGNLYGTTAFGGSFNRGSVFKLDTTGNETVLHSFTGVLDGAFPQAGLVMDKAGNFYGTTGGPGAGTVFKLDTSGNETLLYIFADSPDGASPQAGLVIDQSGNIYGTTTTWGSSFRYGTGFKLDTSNNETVLHSFT